MKLSEAIAEQVIRTTKSEPEAFSQDSEVKDILQAFVYLINAYLKRLEEPDISDIPKRGFPSRVSDTFASNG